MVSAWENIIQWMNKLLFKRKNLLETSLILSGILVWWSWAQVLNGTIWNTVSQILLILFLIGVVIWNKKNFPSIEKLNIKINNIEKWIKWEKLTAYQLSSIQGELPNFHILNSYKLKEEWDIDHIIISEYWIFICDTKNQKNISKVNVVEYSEKLRKSAKSAQAKIYKSIPIPKIESILISVQKQTYPYIKKFCKDEQEVYWCWLLELESFFKKLTYKQISPEKVNKIYNLFKEIQKDPSG